MRIVLLLATLTAALAPQAAHADLYRWVDPQTGSVKFSSYPPPWFGDQARELNAPATEVIVYQAPGAPKPATPAKPSAAASMLAALESQLAGLRQFFTALPSNADFSRAGSGIQQQIEAYQALSAELDRLDPGGAARRRAQEVGVMETLRRGLEAQFGKK
ncbi:MAG TPA: hypothetical protein VEX61_12810 [Burkholderiales bacterium]|nr:hypothetical protein [Burkholderiales bacterium]